MKIAKKLEDYNFDVTYFKSEKEKKDYPIMFYLGKAII